MSISKVKKPLYLATGLQSGGTTLISWSFLQHPLLDGVLDMASDSIFTDLSSISAPNVWVKMTSFSFRWQEVAHIYEMLGYEVRPLLIVRNPYAALSSLRTKWYGKNGLTAEDPPLALRFLRFQEDVKLFVKNKWPVVKFEDFVSSPEITLKDACEQMSIEYDSSMLSWPKRLEDLHEVKETNETFGNNLLQPFGRVEVLRKRVKLSESEDIWLKDNLSYVLDAFDYSSKVDMYDDSYHITPNKFNSRRTLGFIGSRAGNSLNQRFGWLVDTLVEKNINQIVLYGAGEICDELMNYLNDTDVKVVKIYDSNLSLTGNTKKGIPVSSGEKLKVDKVEQAVVVASMANSVEISHMLIDQFGIDTSKVIKI